MVTAEWVFAVWEQSVLLDALNRSLWLVRSWLQLHETSKWNQPKNEVSFNWLADRPSLEMVTPARNPLHNCEHNWSLHDEASCSKTAPAAPWGFGFVHSMQVSRNLPTCSQRPCPDDELCLHQRASTRNGIWSSSSPGIQLHLRNLSKLLGDLHFGHREYRLANRALHSLFVRNLADKSHTPKV